MNTVGKKMTTLAHAVGGKSSSELPSPAVEVSLLTGGRDPHYAVGLATALAARGVRVEFIGSDELDSPILRATPGLKFLNLRGSQRPEDSLGRKIWRVLAYYAHLLRYSATSKTEVFHVLWNNRFEVFDRTLLMLYYRALGKRVALTVHNVNAGTRDGNDSLINRLTLRMQYHLSNHLFVHTLDMKRDLMRDFGVRESLVTVIPYGINNVVPDTGLTTVEAKQRLGIRDDENVILFFGTIRPYKGLEHLLIAYQRLVANDSRCRLIIAGEPKKESRRYAEQIQQIIDRDLQNARVILRMEFIPDKEMEIYFKAADLLVLPYKKIFQSGVLFLAYSFGLPVVATDVGSLREEVVDGKTGFLCRPDDPVELANVIGRYFQSSMFKQLHVSRHEIKCSAGVYHSWDLVAETTERVYSYLPTAF